MPVFYAVFSLGLVLLIAGFTMFITTTLPPAESQSYRTVRQMLWQALRQRKASGPLLVLGVISLLSAWLIMNHVTPLPAQNVPASAMHKQPFVTLSGESSTANKQLKSIAGTTNQLGLPSNIQPLAGTYDLVSYYADSQLQKIEGSLTLHATGRVSDYSLEIALTGLDSNQQPTTFIYQGNLHQNHDGWFINIEQSNDTKWQDAGELPISLSSRRTHLNIGFHYGDTDISSSWELNKADQ